MPRTCVQSRLPWADRFRTPTEDELLGAVSEHLRPAVECIRGELMGLAGTSVSVEWVGIPWRWSLVFRARGMERVLAYVIPCPERPVFVMPLTNGDLEVILSKRTPKYICDGIQRAAEVGGVRWAQWDISAWNQAHELAQLAERRLAILIG